MIVIEPFPGNKYQNPKKITDAPTIREQNDTHQFRLGGEYVFIKNTMLIPIRAGIFTNTPYITDGENNSIIYLGFATGAGISIKDFLFDVAFVYQTGNSFYSADSEGDREFNSKQFYISAIYRFNLFN